MNHSFGESPEGATKRVLEGHIITLYSSQVRIFLEKAIEPEPFADGRDRGPTYLSLYRRGDSPLLKLFWSRIGFAKA